MAVVKISPIARCNRPSSRELSVRGPLLGMNPGVMQHLVRIDVADSREHLLIHERRLDAAGRPRKPLRKLVPGDLERVRPV